jgi:ABC-type multidrug transport system ATPase subunit
MDVPTIVLSNVSKRFNREWIFKDLSATIEPGSKWMIGGGNGSGKSTLLQIISGFISPEKGKVIYSLDNTAISIDSFPKYFSFASPYLQLIEEFSLLELLQHLQLSDENYSGIEMTELIDQIGLSQSKSKSISQFSSGMKQRVKLALAFYSKKPLIFLDEPISNLDHAGVDWFKNLIESTTQNKTIIVCSNNIKEEFFFCDNHLIINNFKS